MFKFDQLKDSGVGNTNIPPHQKETSAGKIKALASIIPNGVSVGLPLFTASEANGGVKKSYKKDGKTHYKSEHWSEKNRRQRLQKTTIHLTLGPYRDKLRLPCHITLKRYAPKELDADDNLRMALKWIKDAVCEVITGDMQPGRADGYKGFTTTYEQEKSKEYWVEITVQNK